MHKVSAAIQEWPFVAPHTVNKKVAIRGLNPSGGGFVKIKHFQIFEGHFGKLALLIDWTRWDGRGREKVKKKIKDSQRPLTQGSLPTDLEGRVHGPAPANHAKKQQHLCVSLAWTAGPGVQAGPPHPCPAPRPRGKSEHFQARLTLASLL